MKTIKLDQNNFEAEVLNSQEPVLVDLYADWCGPCKQLAPTLDQLAKDYSERAKIGKLNVDENPQIAAQFDVSSIPTLILFKDGEVKGRLIGNQTKKSIEEFLGS